ncbi:MAG: ATP-binding protein [Bacteroidia bacterium]
MDKTQTIKRALFDSLVKKILPGKVVVILGPRRTGKSFLLKQILSVVKEKYLLLNGEDNAVVELLQNRRVSNYKKMLGDVRLLVIDEAQKIPGIGFALKLMVDEIEDLKIIATGSSMFDLDQNIGEPLTGRKNTFYLFPLAQMELDQVENAVDIKNNLEDRLIFGSYPELQKLESREAKAEYLKEIVNSYLLKDILSLDSIRNSTKIHDLLRLLALQVGKEVSLEELGRQTGMSKNTVERYFDLLTKVFVIYRVQGFSRNLRKEIVKMSKWYFYDNGIRNTIIANHNPLHLRADVGELWENYLLSERLKFQSYNNVLVNNYFWRTYARQELDWVEDRGGKLYGYEFKWSENKTPKVPSGWIENYPNADFTVINSGNYLDWITGKSDLFFPATEKKKKKGIIKKEKGIVKKNIPHKKPTKSKK